MLSHFFIDRPIFAAVIALVISVVGAVAMVQLPIAQYPQVTPIQIQVTATYPGANAQLVAQNVGAPIEQQVNGANNMMYMQSTSSSTGNYTLTVYFTIDTDPALAQVDVQNRVSQAMAQLPQSVSAQGVNVAQKTSTFLMVVAFFDPNGRYDPNFISNYTNTQILGTINRLPGANQASIFGVPQYAMRIWLKPDRMAQLKISATDVANAIKNQNQQFAVGRIGAAPTPYPVQQTFPVTTSTITEPAQCDNMILRRLRDRAGRHGERLLHRVWRGRRADAAHRELLVLVLDRVGHIRGRDLQLRHAVGLEPDAHRVLRHAEDRRLVRPGEPVDRPENLRVRVVRDEVRIVAAVGIEEGDHHEEGARLLRHVHALRRNRLGKLRHRLAHAVLHVHLGERRIRVDREVHGERVVARRRARRLHVHHVVRAVHLLLDRRAHVLRHELRVGARIGRRHLDLDRRDLRVLGDGQLHHRDGAHDRDHERDDRREDRAVDEEVREHRDGSRLFLLLGGRDDLHRRAGGEPRHAVRGHDVTRLQAAVDEPVVAMPGPDFDRANLRLHVLVDQHDDVALGSLEHRCLRHEDQIRAHRARDSHAHELPGTQRRFGIRQRGAQQESPGLRIEARVGERDAPLVREELAVGEDHLDHVLVVGRELEAALVAIGAQPQHLVLGNREVHPDGIDLLHDREQAVLRVHVGAILHPREARQAGHRRRDRRVGKVELRAFDARPGGLYRRSRGALLADRVVELLLAQCIQARERFHLREVGVGDLEAGPLLRERGIRRVELHPERPLVLPEHHFARLHERAFPVDALVEESGDAGADLHLVRRERLADELVVYRGVLRRDCDGGYLDGRPRRGGLITLAAI